MLSFLEPFKYYIYGVSTIVIITFTGLSIDNMFYKPLRECKTSSNTYKVATDFTLKVVGNKLSECLSMEQYRLDSKNKEILESMFGTLDMNNTGEELIDDKNTTFNLYKYSF